MPTPNFDQGLKLHQQGQLEDAKAISVANQHSDTLSFQYWKAEQELALKNKQIDSTEKMARENNTGDQDE